MRVSGEGELRVSEEREESARVSEEGGKVQE